MRLEPFYISSDLNFQLLKGECVEQLTSLEHSFDVIFADPPYFLSNNGLTIQSGKITSVNKGNWDVLGKNSSINDFNHRWISIARKRLKEDGTIWISGTHHNIFSIAQILNELDFKLLNVITWAKTNPPPNFSCRYFTHSTEYIIWARKSKKMPHYFNYKLMKYINNNKQMKDVWTLPAIGRWEKFNGKHPTQKPLSLLVRILLASTKPNALVLDPFAGSSTTGIAANLINRKFIGIDIEEEYLSIGIRRKLELEKQSIPDFYYPRIKDLAALSSYKV